MKKMNKSDILSSVAITTLLLLGSAVPSMAQIQPSPSLESLFDMPEPVETNAAPPPAEGVSAADEPSPETVEPAATGIVPAVEPVPAAPSSELASPASTDDSLEKLIDTLEAMPEQATTPAPDVSASQPVEVFPPSTPDVVPTPTATPLEPPSNLDPDIAKLLEESDKAVPLKEEPAKSAKTESIPTPLAPPTKAKAGDSAVPLAVRGLPSQRLPSERMADAPTDAGASPVFDPEVDVFEPPSDTVTLYEEGPRGRGFTIPPAGTDPNQSAMTFEPERLPPQAFTPMKDALLMRLEFVPFHSILPPYGDQALKPMVDLLLQNPNIAVTLLGYADVTTKASVRSARNISENRVKTVADYLLKSGVRTEQITREPVGLDLVMGVVRDRVDVRFKELLNAPEVP